MKVTVGIPAFNASAMIGRIIDAVKSQTRAPDEIIVVDDGSRDGTGPEAMSRHVRVITHERNLGLAQARNTILKHAKGDVLVFYDADAVPRPGCLDFLLRHFEDPDVGAVGGRGVESGLINDFQKWRARTVPQDHGPRPIRDDWMLMGLCCSFRKNVVEMVGGFDTTFGLAGEDVDISLRVRRAGFRLVYEPMAVVDHIPGGGLFGVTMQAYKHAKFATVALAKNGEPNARYFVGTYRHLLATAFDDLRSGRVGDTMTGVLNMSARTMGFILGSLKGRKSLARSPRI